MAMTDDIQELKERMLDVEANVCKSGPGWILSAIAVIVLGVIGCLALFRAPVPSPQEGDLRWKWEGNQIQQYDPAFNFGWICVNANIRDSLGIDKIEKRLDCEEHQYRRVGFGRSNSWDSAYIILECQKCGHQKNIDMALLSDVALRSLLEGKTVSEDDLQDDADVEETLFFEGGPISISPEDLAVEMEPDTITLPY